MIGALEAERLFEEIVTIGSQHETAGSDGVSLQNLQGWRDGSVIACSMAYMILGPAILRKFLAR